MGWSFRKSIKIAPGVKINVGKKGIGMSAGTKGFRVGVNSKGKAYTHTSIPGTGLYNHKEYGNSNSYKVTKNKAKSHSKKAMVFTTIFAGFCSIVSGYAEIGIGLIVIGIFIYLAKK